MSAAQKLRFSDPLEIEKLRQCHLGIRHGDAAKEKLRLAHLGRKHTEETKLKMSLTRKGRACPWNLGKNLSPERRKQMSDSAKLRGARVPTTPESIEKMRKSLTGRKLSEEHKAKLRGSSSVHWKGGASRRGRGNPKVKLWRKLVLARDGFRCQRCSSVDEPNAHHIFSFVDAPGDFKHNINNGVTLCKECHCKFHQRYGKGKNTYDQLFEFLYENFAAGVATVLDRGQQLPVAISLDHWGHSSKDEIALDVSTDLTCGDLISNEDELKLCASAP